MKTKQISIYGVPSQDQTHHNGVGLFYNTQNVKLKVEESDTSFKTGTVLQINPFQTPAYVKVGANYIDKNTQENHSINQFSTGIALGYMLYNDLAMEVGGSISELNGYQSTEGKESKTQITKDTYVQISKRFETPIGTIDTQLNESQIHKTLSTREQSYSSSFDYYLNDTIRLNYLYTLNQNDIYNGYSINYSYFTTEYTKNISQDSYNVTMGIKAKFSDIMNISSYKPSVKKKKTFSKSHKFDDMVLRDNMNLRI